jgi:transposase
MFIREVRKKNPGYEKVFVYHRLMESVRTSRGPRQRLLLDLGRLDLPQEEWKILANCIEDIVAGKKWLIPPPKHVVELAQHYAQLLIRKEVNHAPVSPEVEKDWEKVDLNSMSNSECRTIGGEAVAYHAFSKLRIPVILSNLGFSEKQVQQTAILVIGRLLYPGSERETTLWARKISGLAEILDTNFQHLSHNALYRTSDLLRKYKKEIEVYLAEQERRLYSLNETIVLYDLTNTYLAGRSSKSRKARLGRSKERRYGCPLLTLALVLDEDGFPKGSRIFPGSGSEPQTLRTILRELKKEPPGQLRLPGDKPTVVVDAGIATEGNLKLITEAEYNYICIARNRPSEIPQDGLSTIKEGGPCIEAKRLDGNGEVLLYCRSSGRADKEQAMMGLFQRRFEEGLESIVASLTKKGGIKKYHKVMERLGRLREKYPSISQFYQIEVQPEGGKVKAITWSFNQRKAEIRFSGSYYIRTNRQELSDKDLWSLYTMLTQVEAAFRCLKSELGLRPVYHQKDDRMEGHLFISVLAYHLMAAILRELREKGVNHRWETIRTQLATQVRITTSLTSERGQRIHIRQTTDPEPFHYAIHRALGLPLKPLRTKRLKT